MSSPVILPSASKPHKIMAHYRVRDFDAIRITCHHQSCRGVIELAPGQVAAVMEKTKACCPLCGKPFTLPSVEGGADVITMLAKVVLALDQLAPNVGIEFPVRVNLPTDAPQ